ncbi:TolC family protein [Vibrio neptunius]|uniref:TolC family protein n=1 Tax=Vibrio neptunius TaxID=170651 RepID=UPI0019D14711|nr:TolC family protein [Vibrio neptunius]MBN3571571.1 TolC family protein [Vibrio neptunius]
MTLRYSILALTLVGVMGCATGTDVDYAELAKSNSTQSLEPLLKQVIAEKQLKTRVITNEQPTRLTDLIQVPALEQYINAAFANNPSFQQSVIALKIVYAQQGVTVADQLPTASASFTSQSKEDTDDSYTGDVTVSWELDLWQKLADSSEAARKDVAASQASLQSAKDLLAANIMRNWLEISVNQQLLDIELRRLDVLENNEVLVLERYQVGLGSLEDLDNAKTSTSSTRSTVAEYAENLEQSRRSLQLLTGQWQSELEQPEVAMTFPQVVNPLDSLGQQNMAGRPDLQQAFYNIEAEALRTDAAYKAMLPSFSLTASLTDIAQSPSEALLTDPLWSVLGKLSAPLFQGGKLKSQAEIAQFTTEQSYWAYQETLLTAINEVENAVGQEYSLEKQQLHLNQAFTSSKRSFVSYQEKYRKGLVDIFDLLTVQQQTYDTEAQLVNATYQRLLNRIDLGLALGLGVSS